MQNIIHFLKRQNNFIDLTKVIDFKAHKQREYDRLVCVTLVRFSSLSCGDGSCRTVLSDSGIIGQIGVNDSLWELQRPTYTTAFEVDRMTFDENESDSPRLIQTVFIYFLFYYHFQYNLSY